MIDLKQFEGREGYYFRTTAGSVYGPMRFVCLNCRAYFRTKANTMNLTSLMQVGSRPTKYCPCCGAELKHLITPTTIDQQRLELGI